MRGSRVSDLFRALWQLGSSGLFTIWPSGVAAAAFGDRLVGNRFPDRLVGSCWQRRLGDGLEFASCATMGLFIRGCPWSSRFARRRPARDFPPSLPALPD